MIRRLILLVLLLVINIGGLVSCSNVGTCPDVVPNKYCIIYTDLAVRTLNAWGGEEINSGDSIDYNKYSIELMITDDKRICIVKKPSLFGNSAFACRSIEEHYIKDSIIAVEIYSNTDFNDEHKAGKDLAHYFSDLNYDEINSLDYIDTHVLNLKRAPQYTYEHIFTVRLVKKSGEAITAKTVPIKILASN